MTNVLHQPQLSHLKRLTTKIGIIQHSHFTKPAQEFGYSIDDCARALIVSYLLAEVYHETSFLTLAENYFGYIERALTPHGKWHNFANAKGVFTDKEGSQDSFGRTIWALGYMTSKPDLNQHLTKRAKQILKKTIPNIKDLTFLRSKAFTLIGLYYLGEKQLSRQIADELVATWQKYATPEWLWFEETLTYANAILPYSLFLAYDLTKNNQYLKIAEESLRFLQKQSVVDGVPVPVGQNGWYKKGGKKALYDQQVIEATDMILAGMAGWQVSGKKEYQGLVRLWWGWFEGHNLQKKALIDPQSGGCYDGLTPTGLNLNQGAESIICYLLAYSTLAKSKIDLKHPKINL